MIQRQALIDSRAKFFGWGYSLKDDPNTPSKEGPYYPQPIPGVSVPLAVGKTDPKNVTTNTNCCCYIEALVLAAAQASGHALTWDRARHDEMMITGADRFGPVTALITAGLADPTTAVGPWTIAQGWREQWAGGHTFAVEDFYAPTGKVLISEANKAYNVTGVGWRGIGNLDLFDTAHPPTDWWRYRAVWTLEQLHRAYPHIKMCRLKVAG